MFYIIVLAAIMGLIATDLYVPSLPQIAVIFQQSQNHTELTLSLFLLGFAISQLFYGPISDRIGRKLPLMIGVMLFIIGSIICSATPTFWGLCAGRVVQGIGAGAGLSLARVMLRDCYAGTELAVKSSQVGVFITLAPAIAPLLGGLLAQYFGFRSGFIFLTLYGLILCLLLITVFKETNQHKDPHLNLNSTLTNYGRLLSNFTFMRYVVTSGLAFASIILYANIIPFVLQNQLHLSAGQNGMMMLFAAFGCTTGAWTSSRIVQHFSPLTLVQFALLLLLVSGALMIITKYSFSIHLAILIPLLFVVTIACGLIFPNSMTLAFAQINVNIGIAGAIFGSFQILTSMLINFILNAVSNQGLILLGLFYLGIGICGLSMYQIYPVHKKMPVTSGLTG